MQTLTMNSSSQLRVVGPVILVLGNSLTVNGPSGLSTHPGWLTLKIASGSLTLNTGSTLSAMVIAPKSAVTINSTCTLTGNLICDRLTLNSGSVLQPTGN